MNKITDTSELKSRMETLTNVLSKDEAECLSELLQNTSNPSFMNKGEAAETVKQAYSDSCAEYANIYKNVTTCYPSSYYEKSDIHGFKYFLKVFKIENHTMSTNLKNNYQSKTNINESLKAL